VSIVLAFCTAALVSNGPYLRSESVVVRYADTKEILISKNAEVVRPIASVTKLLSGLVFAGMEVAPADDWVTLGEEDKDRLKWSRSRLRMGSVYKLPDLFAAALGASDNRAMYATVRAHGLARSVFVDRMNALARELGMSKSNFIDPAGIDPSNVSTADDLLLLLDAAAASEMVRSRTLLDAVELIDARDRMLVLHNPDRLVRAPGWEIVVGKTGYTVEAGRNLVVRALLEDRPVDMVFLGAREMASVFGDAARVRRWLEERSRGFLAKAAETERPGRTVRP
jgi:D-alanyl-D-alanine endopeptidase (penicillin-binding protein 7)